MIKVIRELVVDSTYLYLIQGLNYLFPLLVLPYLIKTLGPESFGIFAYSQAFVQFLILIVDFGFNISVTKKIATLPENSPRIVEVYWLTTIIKLLLSFVCLIGTFIFLYFFTSFSQYKLAIYWSMLSVFGSVIFPVWLFQGLNQIKIVSLINASSKILTFPLIFILVRGNSDYIAAIILHSSSTLIAGLISVTIILKDRNFRSIPYKKVNKIKIYKTVKDSWPIFLSNSSISLYTTSLTIILGFFASASQVGLFGAIDRIVRVICFGVYVPISQASYPKIARLKLIDFSQARKLFKILFYCVLFLMLSVLAGFFLLEDFFVAKFFKAYTDISLILRVSIFMIVPIALGGVCGQLGLLALGGKDQKKIFSKIYNVVGISSLLLSYLSIRYFNLNGAVFSMMITESLIFIIMFTYVKKYRYL